MQFLWGVNTGLFLASPIILLFKYLNYRKGKLMSNNALSTSTNIVNQTIQVVSVDEIRQQEQSRILALLNSKRGTGSHDAENDFINAFIDDLAALIEGGN